MIVTTPDADEHVSEYKTRYYSVGISKSGRSLVLKTFEGDFSSSTKGFVFPDVTFRMRFDSFIPVHTQTNFFRQMIRRAQKKRVELIRMCPDLDVCMRVHDFLGPDMMIWSNQFASRVYMIYTNRAVRIHLCSCGQKAAYHLKAGPNKYTCANHFNSLYGGGGFRELVDVLVAR